MRAPRVWAIPVDPLACIVCAPPVPDVGLTQKRSLLLMCADVYAASGGSEDWAGVRTGAGLHPTGLVARRTSRLIKVTRMMQDRRVKAKSD